MGVLRCHEFRLTGVGAEGLSEGPETSHGLGWVLETTDPGWCGDWKKPGGQSWVIKHYPRLPEIAAKTLNIWSEVFNTFRETGGFCYCHPYTDYANETEHLSRTTLRPQTPASRPRSKRLTPGTSQPASETNQRRFASEWVDDRSRG